MEVANSKTISKLKDDNGYKWSYDLKMFLGSKDLWKNCEFKGLEEYLRSLDDEDEDEENEKKEKKEKKGKNEKKEISIIVRREWKKDDAKCLSIIGMSVGERFIPTIREATTAH